MTGTVHVSVTATGRECRMGQILTRLEERSRHVSPLVTQADHWAQNFTYGVILVASLFTISSWPFLYEESVLRALALIIVACPCAMAFGAPLALSLSLKRAARSGFLIKDAETLEKLAQIQTIVFDKTGTLTEGKMKVVAWSPTHPPLKIMSIIAALEEDSVHPVGRALYKEAKEQGFLNVPLKLRQWEEIRGQGVRGWWEKDLYEIKSCDNHSNTTWSNQPFSLTSTVGIFRNGELLYKCALGDRVRPEAKAVVQDLMNSGYAVHLLSGDQTSVVKALATDLGIPNTQALAKQSPEAKEQYLEQIPKALMIGDGANDALALQAAHVGAALHGSVELSLQAADLYIFRSGLAPVLDLLNSARQAITAVRRNLAISIVYNGGFGFCALMGWVEPLAAALLMPMSSIIILLTTLHSTRTIKAKLTS
jgi:Cu2+-exporting ATPase/Cu+-exporting ATPase